MRNTSSETVVSTDSSGPLAGPAADIIEESISNFLDLRRNKYIPDTEGRGLWNGSGAPI